ncbi:MAG: DUF6152 family protein [Gammaproteobacteria bacterium]
MRMKRILAMVTALTFMSGAAWQVSAHHSFVGQFDPEKLVTMSGTVTKLEWTNPHAFFYIDVEDSDGNVTNWALELGSPNTLIRYRWGRDTMKVGDEVTVEGYLARDGTNLANAKTVTFPDGRVVNAGSSSELGSTR